MNQSIHPSAEKRRPQRRAPQEAILPQATKAGATAHSAPTPTSKPHQLWPVWSVPVHVVGEAGDHVLPEVVVDPDGRGLALHEPHLRIALEFTCGEQARDAKKNKTMAQQHVHVSRNLQKLDKELRKDLRPRRIFRGYFIKHRRILVVGRPLWASRNHPRKNVTASSTIASQFPGIVGTCGLSS